MGVQGLPGFLHYDMNRLAYPVDILKPETAYVTDPQSQPGDHQQDRIIPFPFWVFSVNSRQEFLTSSFPGIGDRPIPWYPDFGKQIGKVVAGKATEEQKMPGSCAGHTAQCLHIIAAFKIIYPKSRYVLFLFSFTFLPQNTSHIS